MDPDPVKPLNPPGPQTLRTAFVKRTGFMSNVMNGFARMSSNFSVKAKPSVNH